MRDSRRGTLTGTRSTFAVRAEAAFIRPYDVQVGQILRPTNVDCLTGQRIFFQRPHSELSNVAGGNEVSRLLTATEDDDFLALDDGLAKQDMRVKIHERSRSQDGVA